MGRPFETSLQKALIIFRHWGRVLHHVIREYGWYLEWEYAKMLTRV